MPPSLDRARHNSPQTIMVPSGSSFVSTVAISPINLISAAPAFLWRDNTATRAATSRLKLATMTMTVVGRIDCD